METRYSKTPEFGEVFRVEGVRGLFLRAGVSDSIDAPIIAVRSKGDGPKFGATDGSGLHGFKYSDRFVCLGMLKASEVVEGTVFSQPRAEENGVVASDKAPAPGTLFSYLNSVDELVLCICVEAPGDAPNTEPKPKFWCEAVGKNGGPEPVYNLEGITFASNLDLHRALVDNAERNRFSAPAFDE